VSNTPDSTSITCVSASSTAIAGPLRRAHYTGVPAISWLRFLALIALVAHLFLALYRLLSTIEPDEQKGDGEHWWRGGG
jgi:hypothetical protein